MFLVSDVLATQGLVEDFYFLEDREICWVKGSDVRFWSFQGRMLKSIRKA